MKAFSRLAGRADCRSFRPPQRMHATSPIQRQKSRWMFRSAMPRLGCALIFTAGFRVKPLKPPTLPRGCNTSRRSEGPPLELIPSVFCGAPRIVLLLRNSSPLCCRSKAKKSGTSKSAHPEVRKNMHFADYPYAWSFTRQSFQSSAPTRKSCHTRKRSFSPITLLGPLRSSE